MTTTRKLTRFQYAAALLGALAVVAIAPATANALPPGGTGADGGCHYSDKDGYDIPIDEGQSVLVDGKTVTCTGGTVVVSNIGPKKPLVNKLPVLNRSAAIG